MDNQIDVEALRATLRAMTRGEVIRIAAAAEVPASTVQKFRGGHINEPGAFKVQALMKALAADKPALAPKRRKKPAAA